VEAGEVGLLYFTVVRTLQQISVGYVIDAKNTIVGAGSARTAHAFEAR
jgi:hypothetical protein